MSDLLTVTVVSARAMGESSFDLSHEIDLVKTGLMYGDRVELVSLQAVTLSTVLAAFVAPEPLRRELFEKIALESPASAVLVETLRELRAKKGKTKQEILTLARIEEVFREGNDLMLESLEGILSESNISELILASEAGVLKLDPLGLEAGDRGLDSGLVLRFGEVLEDLVAPGSNAFPMFDDDAGSWAKAIATERGIPLVLGGRPQEVRLAGDLISNLPAFGETSMAKVLEAREALAEPLVRFRAALVILARSIEEYPGDPDFRVRVEDVWRSEVIPAFAEMRELEAERKVGPLFKHAVRQGPGAKAVEATVGAYALATNVIPVLIAAMAGAAADIASTALSRHESLGKESRSNRFAFLYESEEKLKD